MAAAGGGYDRSCRCRRPTTCCATCRGGCCRARISFPPHWLQRRRAPSGAWLHLHVRAAAHRWQQLHECRPVTFKIASTECGTLERPRHTKGRRRLDRLWTWLNHGTAASCRIAMSRVNPSLAHACDGACSDETCSMDNGKQLLEWELVQVPMLQQSIPSGCGVWSAAGRASWLSARACAARLVLQQC